MKLLPFIPAEKVKEFDIAFLSGTSAISVLIKDDNKTGVVYYQMKTKMGLRPGACFGYEINTKMITKSPWSHTAIAVQTKIGLMWEEALKEGVVLSDLAKYLSAGAMKQNKFDGALLMRFSSGDDCVMPEGLRMRIRAKQLLGKKYDFLALLVGFPIMIWLKLRGLFVRTSGRWVCSSLIAEIYRSGGITLVSHRKTKSVSPEDLFQSSLLEIVE